MTYPACRAYWSFAEQTNSSVQEKERKEQGKKERKETKEVEGNGRYRKERKLET
jgi:hypothetical protein